ncbi:hypothetical protein BBK82_38305 [Lentzea guizhouensis]|uniref:Uncharacterized protein n=1 Tax=Lentzea guizhouensis TaxID=1586287 RepID=A0A1B2HTC6_9PSEU|nr:hypothetical protein BBK82_38305 [Lentzea guizhouensis]
MSAPDEVLLRLDDDVRAAGAANPALPADRLRQALADKLPNIRQTAASNPSLTAAEIGQLCTGARGDPA